MPDLIWHTYPNIGIDNKNQYDWLRDMPGGLKSVRGMVEDFHRRGVKVFFPVTVWDQGTRDEGKPLWDATAEIMKAIDADSVNGDTMDGMPEAFSRAAAKADHPLALEPIIPDTIRCDLGLPDLPLRPPGEPEQMAGAARHGEYQRPLEPRQDG